MKNKYYIDLFAGAGGLGLGFEQAGFIQAGFVEFWKPAIETQLLHNEKAKLIGEDIIEVHKDQLKDVLNSDVIVGGPPCQGFSMAGSRNPNDKRNTLFLDYLRIVSIVKPRFCVMENVKGIYTMKSAEGQYVFKIIVDEFEKLGYTVIVKVLNSFNYGVPQRRQRVIFIAMMDAPEDFKVKFPWPKPVDKIFVRDIMNLPYEEIEKIQHVYTKNKKLMKKGFYLVPGKKLSSYGSAGIKLKWGAACTITKTGRYSHPEFNRLISIREAARIQTFPDSYEFAGNNDEMYGQIGNAVPVKMARVIAESIGHYQNSVLNNQGGL